MERIPKGVIKIGHHANRSRLNVLFCHYPAWHVERGTKLHWKGNIPYWVNVLIYLFFGILPLP